MNIFQCGFHEVDAAPWTPLVQVKPRSWRDYWLTPSHVDTCGGREVFSTIPRTKHRRPSISTPRAMSPCPLHFSLLFNPQDSRCRYSTHLTATRFSLDALNLFFCKGQLDLYIHFSYISLILFLSCSYPKFLGFVVLLLWNSITHI